MPKKNINYSNTIIYKLCCKDLSITEVYVGQTTDFRRRKNHHKTACNNEKIKNYNSKVYTFIRDNGGFDNWDMIEIERFEAIDGYDAKKRERHWIETLKATLNGNIPSRTKKEYYEDYKIIINECNKYNYYNNIEKEHKRAEIYYKNNKEIINEKRKDKIKCECGCEVRKQGLTEHKQTKKHIDLMSQKVLSDTVVD